MAKFTDPAYSSTGSIPYGTVTITLNFFAVGTVWEKGNTDPESYVPVLLAIFFTLCKY